MLPSPTQSTGTYLLARDIDHARDRSSASKLPRRYSRRSPTSLQYPSMTWAWNGRPSATQVGQDLLAEVVELAAGMRSKMAGSNT